MGALRVGNVRQYPYWVFADRHTASAARGSSRWAQEFSSGGPTLTVSLMSARERSGVLLMMRDQGRLGNASARCLSVLLMVALARQSR